MTWKMVFTAAAVLTVGFAIGEASPTAADAAAQPAQQQQKGAKIDPKEEAAYKAFTSATDPAAQVKAGQEFEASFPNSRYLESVQSTLVSIYYNQQDYPNFYAEADRALAKDPDNVPVLTLEGWLIPRDYKADDPTEPTKLDKAEKAEKHALDLIGTMAKPAGLTDQQFNDAKANAASQAHSGLGMTYFRKNDFANSAKELESATMESTDPDPSDLYVLGVDYQKLNRDADAVGAFTHCAQLPGQMQDRCKQAAQSAQTLK